jgi:hypothetical protein
MARPGLALCTLALLLSSGCPRLYDEFPPLAAEMLILGVENKIRGEDFSWEPAHEEFYTSVQLHLFEATTIDQLGDIPVEDVVVTLWGPNMGRVELLDNGNGYYSLDSAESLDLRYGPKLDFEINLLYAGKDRSATLWLPDAPWAEIPSSHTASSDMNLTLNPDNFDATVELVFDQSGAIVHNTEPESLIDLLGMSEGDTSVGSAQIPGSIFTNPGSLRGVGVAGLRVDRGEENFVNIEPAASRMVAGMMELYEVEIE